MSSPPMAHLPQPAAPVSTTDDLVSSGVLLGEVGSGSGGMASLGLGRFHDALSLGSPGPSAFLPASSAPPSSQQPASSTLSSASSAPNANATFPVWALQPKKETGARAFLTKYPEYDGRGTIIAILDSGVDPGAGGMQVTTDGKRKVIDRIDASGAGDVDMSKIVEPDDNGKIKGATGRELRLPTEVIDKGFKFRIGCKRAFPLFPRSLKERMIKERQEKIWDPQHKPKVAETHRKLQEFEAEAGDLTSLSGMSKLEHQNHEVEMELLTASDKKFKDNNGGLNGDLGPIYDIVLYHDGESWVSLIDTSESGDLSQAVRLRPFRETGDFAPLTDDDKCNVSINVYDEGKTLQLVSMCSSHGTHVASISAAHFPDDPDRNGLAPGAQIVSITIGDARLHSMETGTALVRAMSHIMRADHYKVDVINMSYGEHSHWSNTGRVGELMGEVINKHGIIWVASAGNDGPAMSTVGTPPDIATNTVIGVGAYVSPEMMLALYSTREKLPGTPYTWTSRGPTIDGERGVSICAPGGAITSVPTFTRRCTQLMNGTSMASPHVAGAVCLLLSGMKQTGLSFSPFSVKRALENTGLHLPNNCHYAQGHGLLQVEQAFDHLTRHHSAVERDVRFVVTCNGGSKGIHVRNCELTGNRKQEVSVKVEPVFLNPTFTPAEHQINFNLRLALTCQAPWVSFPPFLDLMYCSRHFIVSIDQSGLQPGAHSAYVKAYDVQDPRKGHLFEIPITVVVPEPIQTESRPHVSYTRVTFGPGEIKRHFLPVPQKATWAVIRMHSHEKTNNGKFVVHTVQLAPKLVVRSWEYHKMFTLTGNGEFVYSIPVKEMQILEVCLAKWWAHIGNIECSYSITFHGLTVDRGASEITFHGAEGINRIEIGSALNNEEVQPEIKLKSLVQNFRPHESKISPLGDRDIIPPNRHAYELQLAYNFSLSKTTEITPNFPWLSNVLYESEFESQLWMLYNSHKQLVACGDAFPTKWTVKVDKEDYVLRVHVRSENKSVLDKLTDLPLLLTSKLTNSGVSMDVYTSHDQASTGGRKASTFVLAKGSIVPIYVTSINGDKFLKNCTQGQYLQGTLTLAKDELGKKVDCVKVKYILHEATKNKDKATGQNSKKQKTDKEVEQLSTTSSSSTSSMTASANTSDSLLASPAPSGKKTKKGSSEVQNLQDSLREHKISWLSKQDFKNKEAVTVYEELLADEIANQVQIRMIKLNSLDLDKKFSLEPTNEQKEKAEVALKICKEVVDKINIEEVLAHSAVKVDPRSDAADIKKEMDKQKNWYVEAMAKMGLAHLCLGNIDDADKTLLDLLRVAEPTESRVVTFAGYHAESAGHLGRAMKLAIGQLEAKPGNIDLENRILHLAESLGWTHIADLGKKSLALRYPEAYEPF